MIRNGVFPNTELRGWRNDKLLASFAIGLPSEQVEKEDHFRQWHRTNIVILL
jgi:hypothetical protein